MFILGGAEPGYKGGQRNKAKPQNENGYVLPITH
jgi:hypothetical protein